MAIKSKVEAEINKVIEMGRRTGSINLKGCFCGRRIGSYL